jgi:hypothetical protein
MSFLEPTTYNWSWFNGLSAIEVADEEMHDQNKLGIALSALGPIFMRYEVCDTWGISLLHKHWPLEDGVETRARGHSQERRNAICHTAESSSS